MEGAYPAIVTSDPNLVTDVLSKQFDKFYVRRVSYKTPFSYLARIYAANATHRQHKRTCD